jgi:DNA-binding response OmpR family regulator
MDGFEVLEQVRAKHCKTPILVLTAVDAVPKILQAFDLGADDYLVKPFILENFYLRASAPSRDALRRSNVQQRGVKLPGGSRFAPSRPLCETVTLCPSSVRSTLDQIGNPIVIFDDQYLHVWRTIVYPKRPRHAAVLINGQDK